MDAKGAPNRLLPTLSPYQPTLRDRAANKLLDLLGDNPRTQRFVQNLLGSTGLGQQHPVLADLTGLTLPFQADEAGRQIAHGHPVAGGANMLMAAVPLPAAARVAKVVSREANRLLPTAAKEAEKVAAPIVAYHGSPHAFEAFSLEHVGTGEGAQAYGHGLYFAENENVARTYRDKLTDSYGLPQETLARYFTPGRAVEGYGGHDRVVAFRPGTPDDPHGWSVDVIRSDRNGNPLPGERVRNHATQPDAAKVNEVLGGGAGHMYQVGINADPKRFLDWEAPLADHPDDIQNAVLNVRFKGDADQVRAAKASPFYMGRSVQSIIYDLGHDTVGGSPAKASAALAEQGVPGIKYLDWGSRGAGQGTRNYVIFNPAILDIMKRYGVAAPVAASMLAAQQSQPQAGAIQ